MSDGKHSLQTRGLIVLLISKAAGTAPGMDVMEKDLVSGILPRLAVTFELSIISFKSFILLFSFAVLYSVTFKIHRIADLRIGLLS